MSDDTDRTIEARDNHLQRLTRRRVVDSMIKYDFSSVTRRITAKTAWGRNQWERGDGKLLSSIKFLGRKVVNGTPRGADPPCPTLN